MLTELEQELVADIAAVWNKLLKAVGPGDARAGDLSELALHIHALQNAVLAQAAARQYPDQYRLLGGDRFVPELYKPIEPIEIKVDYVPADT